MKKNKTGIIFLICLLSILVVGLIAFLVVVLTNNKGNFSFGSFSILNKVSNKLVFDETYENNFESIILDTDSADIEVKESSDNNIKVVIYSEKEKTKKIDVTDNNNELNITLENEKQFTFFPFNYVNSKIEVYIPETYDNKIKVYNSYGDITISEFNNSDITVEADCGDIVIDGGNNLNVNNSYGDIKINSANNLKVVADCGDVNIGETKNATIKNSYGNITINSVTEYLNLTDDCGDIEIDNVNLTKSSNIKNNYGDIEIKDIKNVYIDAKTELGDVSINNNYHKSDIILKIENDCGDIEVDN